MNKRANVKRPRPNPLSLRVAPEVRNMLVRLTAVLTLKRGQRVTMTEVLEQALAALARAEGA